MAMNKQGWKGSRRNDGALEAKAMSEQRTTINNSTLH